MKNKEIAKIFYEMSDYLRMEGESFRSHAYRKAALVIEELQEDLEQIYFQGGIIALKEISGIGQGIALKIEEYIKTNKIKTLGRLKKKTPVNLEELIAVEGMGPKKAKVLYQKLGIKNVKQLERAAKQHKIAPLFGFGEVAERNILQGIEFLKRSKGRFLLGEILPQAREICQKLKKLSEVKEVSLAGSLRRRKETIADIDILAASNKPERVMDYFVRLPGTVKVWGKGTTKSSIKTEDGLDVDLRVVRQRSFGSALQYFTGSKEHNIAARKIAISKGLKLNEYGLFRGKQRVAGRTEEEVYKKIGLTFIPPELREDQGEIEAALRGKLSKIIDYQDIRGDLHCHSNWNGGINSIEEMVEAAQEMGYQYVGISDHTKFLRIERGLNEKQLSRQGKEIDKINKRFKVKGVGFRVLQGAETNILKDGSIDIKDEALAKLDFAIAGIHSNFKLAKEEMTERIIRAMKNPYVKIISHPTGRILKKRDEYEVDFAKLLRAAKDTKTAMEINSFPKRLDLNAQNIRRAKEAGVRMVINTDSHRKDHLGFIELGIAQARRGWAEKNDIINAQSLEKLLEYFK